MEKVHQIQSGSDSMPLVHPQNIADFRELRCITRQELGDAVGVTKGGVAHLEGRGGTSGHAWAKLLPYLLAVSGKSLEEWQKPGLFAEELQERRKYLLLIQESRARITKMRGGRVYAVIEHAPKELGITHAKMRSKKLPGFSTKQLKKIADYFLSYEKEAKERTNATEGWLPEDFGQLLKAFMAKKKLNSKQAMYEYFGFKDGSKWFSEDVSHVPYKVVRTIMLEMYSVKPVIKKCPTCNGLGTITTVELG